MSQEQNDVKSRLWFLEAAELEATDDILQWNWERGILLELHNCSIARLVFGLMASRDHPSLDPFILAVSDMRPSPAADEVIFAIVRRFHLSINAKTAHAVVRLIKKSVLRAPLSSQLSSLFVKICYVMCLHETAPSLSQKWYRLAPLLLPYSKTIRTLIIHLLRTKTQIWPLFSFLPIDLDWVSVLTQLYVDGDHGTRERLINLFVFKRIPLDLIAQAKYGLTFLVMIEETHFKELFHASNFTSLGNFAFILAPHYRHRAKHVEMLLAIASNFVTSTVPMTLPSLLSTSFSPREIVANVMCWKTFLTSGTIGRQQVRLTISPDDLVQYAERCRLERSLFLVLLSLAQHFPHHHTTKFEEFIDSNIFILSERELLEVFPAFFEWTKWQTHNASIRMLLKWIDKLLSRDLENWGAFQNYFIESSFRKIALLIRCFMESRDYTLNRYDLTDWIASETRKQFLSYDATNLSDRAFGVLFLLRCLDSAFHLTSGFPFKKEIHSLLGAFRDTRILENDEPESILLFLEGLEILERCARFDWGQIAVDCLLNARFLLASRWARVRTRIAHAFLGLRSERKQSYIELAYAHLLLHRYRVERKRILLSPHENSNLRRLFASLAELNEEDWLRIIDKLPTMMCTSEASYSPKDEEFCKQLFYERFHKPGTASEKWNSFIRTHDFHEG